MKTADHYSRISYISFCIEIGSLLGALFTPDPFDLVFSIMVVVSAAVAIWAVFKEKKASFQVPAPEFTKEGGE